MKEKKKRTLTLGETLMYAMGIFGIQLFIGYVNSYQSQFYTSMYGDAVSLMAVAVIILVSKLVSAIADPYLYAGVCAQYSNGYRRAKRGGAS